MGVQINFVDKERIFRFGREFESCLKSILTAENKKLGEINLILTSNRNIIEINREFLKHDYFTDVITFSDNKRNNLSGDIYISLDQIRVNARKYHQDDIRELARVIIHGILHLIGYKDKTESEQKSMREKEDIYLCRFNWNDIIVKSEARI